MLHDMDHAISDYSEAIHLNPSNPEAYRLRSNVYGELGDKDRADADSVMAKRLEGRRNKEKDREGGRATEEGKEDRATPSETNMIGPRQ
jgi:hypothetical protein